MNRNSSVFRQNFLRFVHDSLEQQAQQGYLRELPAREISDHMQDFSSNDYLGLHQDPAVIRAATEAMALWGTGSTGSRLVSGNFSLIENYEKSLAEFCCWESTLVFSSGYLANLAAITSLHKRPGTIFSDQGSHASLIDGCRLTKSQTIVFPRGDVHALRSQLEKYRKDYPLHSISMETLPLIISDAVYSIDGKIAPIAEYYALAQEFHAILLVDEAHSIGVIGSRGQGVVHSLGLSQADGLIVTGTLSKSFGAQGGFILSARIMRDYFINFARQFIFDTGLTPAAVGAANQALHIMQNNPTLFSQIEFLRQLLCAELDKVGLAYLYDDSATYSPSIISLQILDPKLAKAAQLLCHQYGYAVGCFRPPSVPRGLSLLRITLKAYHCVSDIMALVDVLQRVYHELGVLIPSVDSHNVIQGGDLRG